MSVLSPLQTLPLHVAEAIARHYVSTSRFSYSSKTAKSKHQKNAWLVLYDISYSWRILALSYFCNEVTFTVAARIEKSRFTFARLPRGIKKKNIELYNYVKKVNIDICYLADKPSEEKLMAFYTAWPEGLVFPSARSLSISLVGIILQLNAKGNVAESEMITWIAQHIPTSIPMLQQAKIYSNIPYMYMPKSTALSYVELKADRLFSSIFAKVKRLEFSVNSIHIDRNCIFMQNFSGFTSLRFNCSINIDLFHYIVQISAPMLESLDIVNFCCENLRKLFYDDDNRPMTYPKLQKLDFDLISYVKAKDMLSLDKSIVPFPALTHLNWPTTYTFSDDTLFRGNSDTLEYLSITFDTNLMEIVERYNVFSGGKYSKLRHIAARKTSRINIEQMGIESFASFATSLIAPETRSFKISDYNPQHPLADAITTNRVVENIRVLDLGEAKLVLLDMLDLIKLLPNVTDFACLPGGIGPELSKKREKLIQDLYADYYPLSHRLRCWMLPHTNSITTRSIALMSITLAILCTKFTFTDLPHDKRKSYNHGLSMFLVTEGYKKYAAKIKPLFYHE